MMPFEYLSVLISIVLGFGLTELLSGVQRLVHARHRVRLHWLPLTWSGLVFVTLVQWWWAAFGLRDRMEWDFFSFRLILLVPVLLYLAAALILPNLEQGENYDLRAHYFAVGYALLGWLVETVASRPYAEFLRFRVLEPAGLDETGLLVGQAVVENLARPYAMTPTGVAAMPRGKHLGVNPGGGLYSTTRDLHRWMRALKQETILPDSLQALLFTPPRKKRVPTTWPAMPGRSSTTRAAPSG